MASGLYNTALGSKDNFDASTHIAYIAKRSTKRQKAIAFEMAP